jgi:hypothetical protein
MVNFCSKMEQEPILRLLISHLKRRHCMMRFSKYVEENIFVFKTHKAALGIVIFYSAGVVTQDRRTVSR